MDPNFDELDEELLPQDGVATGQVPMLDPALLANDPAVFDARETRDKDVALANLSQGITDIGASLASQGRVRANPAVFDAARKEAQTTADEAGKDALSRRKTVSDFIKAKMSTDRQKSTDDYRNRHLDLMAEQNAALRGQQKADKLNTGVGHLSKSLADSGLDELDTISTRLDGSLGLNDPKKTDVPGFGGTYGLPEIMLSGEGKAARQDVQALKNVILKMRSGGSVTPQEAERMLGEIGEGYARNDAQLKRGVQGVLSQLRAKAATIKAGSSPEVLAEFESRGGKIPKFQPKAPPPAETRRKTKDGRIAVFDADKNFVRYED